jgi:uncharacterized protein with ParB-like and HNH nuclease domain
MKASEQSFAFLAQVISLEVPFFQRHYVWEEENREDMFNDLSLIGNKFFGSIILKYMEATTNKVNTAMIIDGQQRLTTLTIFFKALTDSLPENNKAQADITLSRILFYQKNTLSADKHIKLKHSLLDRQAYDAVIKGGFSPDSTEGIVGCYNFFKKKCDGLTDEKKSDIFTWLTDENNKILVVIELSKEEDEQKIFDTINTAGVHLSVFDIVKNALFSRLLKQNNNENYVKEFHEKTFNKTFDTDDESRTYWDENKKVGRITFDNMEILLHSIAVIKGFYNPISNRLDELSVLYKGYIDKLSSQNDTEQFIEEIVAYANLYREKFTLINDSVSLSYDDGFTRARHILEKSDISALNPYLLKIVKDLDDKKIIQTDFDEKCKELEKYIMRRFVNNDDTKSYSILCSNLILGKGQLEIVDNDALNKSLRYISNNRARLVLFWIELYRRHINKNVQGITSLHYGYTLEHIMPQKWQEHWGIKKLQNETDENYQNRKNKRAEAIYSIGNMTLLKGALNSSVRNYAIDKKIDAPGRYNSIRKCGDLLVAKEIVEQYDNAKTKNEQFVWDENKIENRAKELVKEFFKLW